MIVTELGIRDFRIIEDLSITPHASLNLIKGNNGSGKTSILEALQCLATGHSFRTRQPKELIAFNRESYRVNASFVDLHTKQEHRAGLEKQRGGPITLRLNYEDVKVQSEIAQLLPIKVLTPDSHFLIQQGPEERRNFLDWGLFHVKHEFLNQWRIFRRSLTQRNQILKTPAHIADIKAWDRPLADSGSLITEYRSTYLQSLQTILKTRLEIMQVAFDIQLEYRTGWDSSKELEKVLAENLDTHRKMRTTTDGPHRADMVVMSNGIRARQVLSRGQQKTLVYALHLSQLDLMHSITNKNSVMLCDDLLSELDSEHLNALIEQICSTASQTFITGTQMDALSELPHHMFHMEHGLCEKRL